MHNLCAVSFVLSSAVSCSKLQGPDILGRKAYVFPGLAEVRSQSDGTYLLRWDKVPAIDTVYSVYQRKGTEPFDFKNPNYTTTENTLFIGKLSWNEKSCFLVRFYVPGIKQEENVVEHCTSVAVDAAFSGISNLDSKVSGTASLSWGLSANSDVAGYNVYEGEDFKTIVKKVAATRNSIDLVSLVTDETYTFGVRAYDKSGREDSNGKTMSVKILNNLAPTFFTSGIVNRWHGLHRLRVHEFKRIT